jgi:hypothetical protein
MRNLFALIGVLVVGIGVGGWYLGWYKVNVTKNPEGSLQIQTDVDTQKVNGDSSAFFQKVGTMVNDKTQQVSQDGNTTPATTPANTPGNTSTKAPPTSNPHKGNAPSTSNGPMP